MSSHPQTPCIGICSTTYGDNVCRGCSRFVDEVIAWNGYTEAQKKPLWQRLNRLTAMVVDYYISIEDSALLQQQLEYQNIPFPLELSPPGLVLRLFRALASSPINYAAFGLSTRPAAKGRTPRELYQLMSAERWALSQIHYQRRQRAAAQ